VLDGSANNSVSSPFSLINNEKGGERWYAAVETTAAALELTKALINKE